MAVKFQYNKTSLQQLDKQLKIRLMALPTLKSKESALRMEVRKALEQVHGIEKEIGEATAEYLDKTQFWAEFDSNLLKVRKINLKPVKIAGIKIPELESVEFDMKEFPLLNRPFWFLQGVEILKTLASLLIKKEIYMERYHLLDHARKKTTQKVNLFEKVQIPDYNNAIRKIKRYLEDEENLNKSAQKIVKQRQENARKEEAA